MSCSDEPHVHYDITLLGLFHGHQINMDGNPLGFILDRTIADRIATLLARHGLDDIPENAAEIAPPPHWAPPTGRPRNTLASIQRLPDDPTKNSEHH